METSLSKRMTRILAVFVLAAPILVQAGPEELAKIESDHGLSLAISGFIFLLPKALVKLQKPAEPRPAPKPMTPKVNGLDPATLTAIAMVLHAEAERSAGQGMKVTLPLSTSPWALSSQMRVLPSRIHS
jgi:hypothetical protein